ncbi:MAG: hypothetical protein ABIA77_05475 [Candidatus Omnitrophota bacterium]
MMTDLIRPHYAKRFWLLNFLLFVLLFCCILFVFADRIAAFAINHYTDYRVTYSKWGKSPFDRSQIEGLCIEAGNKRIAIRAEKVRVGLKLDGILKERRLSISCVMEKVDLSMAVKGPVPEPSAGLISVFLRPVQEYDKVSFTLLCGKDVLNISDFKAASKDLCVEGDIDYSKRTNNVSVDLKLSVSPQMYDALSDDITEKILSRDEDGWYGTVIEFKGSIILLKALYSLS